MIKVKKEKIFYKKIIKSLVGITFALIISVTCGGTIVHAAPAPSLTSVSITDITADQNDKVYIEVTEVGTSRMRFVYCNNQLLEENLNEMVMLDFNGYDEASIYQILDTMDLSVYQ